MYRKPRRMFPIIGIIVSLPIIALGLFGFFYKFFTADQNGRATGKIVSISGLNARSHCSFSYTFKVNSTIFQGGGTEYKDNCSEIKASGTVAVTYNTDDPQNNSPRHGQAEWRSTVVMLETIGFGILIACIVRLRYIHRNFDATGDGIGDNRPATNEQMKIIENGMRELGQFYAIPSSRLTHEQAKQAIDNINQQIANMRAHKKL